MSSQRLAAAGMPSISLYEFMTTVRPASAMRAPERFRVDVGELPATELGGGLVERPERLSVAEEVLAGREHAGVAVLALDSTDEPDRHLATSSGSSP